MQEMITGFYIAPFVIDGTMEGFGYWQLDQLSPQWLESCKKQIEHKNGSFAAKWDENLSHISAKFTISQGVALITFQIDGATEASVLLASGNSKSAEAEVFEMFVASLRETELVKLACEDPKPFERIFAIEERPLMIVVPWPNDQISEIDHNVVQELAVHTAGAFFRDYVVK